MCRNNAADLRWLYEAGAMKCVKTSCNIWSLCICRWGRGKQSGTTKTWQKLSNIIPVNWQLMIIILFGPWSQTCRHALAYQALYVSQKLLKVAKSSLDESWLQLERSSDIYVRLNSDWALVSCVGINNYIQCHLVIEPCPEMGQMFDTLYSVAVLKWARFKSATE